MAREKNSSDERRQSLRKHQETPRKAGRCVQSPGGVKKQITILCTLATPHNATLFDETSPGRSVASVHNRKACLGAMRDVSGPSRATTRHAEVFCTPSEAAIGSVHPSALEGKCVFDGWPHASGKIRSIARRQQHVSARFSLQASRRRFAQVGRVADGRFDAQVQQNSHKLLFLEPRRGDAELDHRSVWGFTVKTPSSVRHEWTCSVSLTISRGSVSSADAVRRFRVANS